MLGNNKNMSIKFVEPKMWEDLKSDEKIERTREEVKKANTQLSRRIMVWIILLKD